MIIVGKMTFHLMGASAVESAPHGFFAGVAHLVTGGSWSAHEKQERFAAVQFAENAHRALASLGITNLVRISVGTRMVYERRSPGGDPFADAMARLKEMISTGYEADEHVNFDLVYRYEDDAMTCVIRLDFVRLHGSRNEPLAIYVTGIPRDMARAGNESDEEYAGRVANAGLAVPSAEARVADLLNRLRGALAAHLRGDSVDLSVSRNRMQATNPNDLLRFTSFPGPLYGFNGYADLSYLWLQPKIRGVRSKHKGTHTHSSIDNNWSVDDASWHHHSGGDSTGGWFDTGGGDWSDGGVGAGFGGGGGDSWGDSGGCDGGGDGGGGDGGGGGGD